MSIGNTINKEVRAWGSLAIVIVIISVVLLKFKSNNVGDAMCGGPNYWLNKTDNICCVFNAAGGKTPLGTGATPGVCSTANSTALSVTGSAVDTFVSALSEPKNWVVIVIIAIIGIALFKMFASKKQGGL